MQHMYCLHNLYFLHWNLVMEYCPFYSFSFKISNYSCKGGKDISYESHTEAQLRYTAFFMERKGKFTNSILNLKYAFRSP